jgi:hypothetical protein
MKYTYMRTDDQTGVVCGGDPENYLKAYFKGLYFDLDDGEEIQIKALREKFPMGEAAIKTLAENAGLKMYKYKDNGDIIYIYLKK